MVLTQKWYVFDQIEFFSTDFGTFFGRFRTSEFFGEVSTRLGAAAPPRRRRSVAAASPRMRRGFTAGLPRLRLHPELDVFFGDVAGHGQNT